jgi:hypothetical protein
MKPVDLTHIAAQNLSNVKKMAEFVKRCIFGLPLNQLYVENQCLVFRKWLVGPPL